jgi:hypothetical protein
VCKLLFEIGTTRDLVMSLMNWSHGTVEDKYKQGSFQPKFYELHGWPMHPNYQLPIFQPRDIGDAPPPPELVEFFFPRFGYLVEAVDQMTKTILDSTCFDMSAIHFVETIRYASKRLPERLAVAMDKYPDHPVFQHIKMRLDMAGLLGNWNLYAASLHIHCTVNIFREGNAFTILPAPMVRSYIEKLMIEAHINANHMLRVANPHQVAMLAPLAAPLALPAPAPAALLAIGAPPAAPASFVYQDRTLSNRAIQFLAAKNYGSPSYLHSLWHAKDDEAHLSMAEFNVVRAGSQIPWSRICACQDAIVAGLTIAAAKKQFICCSKFMLCMDRAIAAGRTPSWVSDTVNGLICVLRGFTSNNTLSASAFIGDVMYYALMEPITPAGVKVLRAKNLTVVGIRAAMCLQGLTLS